MSTRRARIKAVTALPPRRKNVVAIDNATNRVPPKQTENLALESPRCIPPTKTTKELEADVTEIFSVRKENYESSTDDLIPTTTSRVLKQNEQDVTKCKETEKSSVITSITKKNDINNVFASPLARNSPKLTLTSPRQSPHIVSGEYCKPSNSQHQGTPKYYKITENKELQLTFNSVNEVTQNLDASKKLAEDYQVSSVPERISEDPMDGIVPLQTTRAVPKPIEALKSEIISEHAEVVFDPIVPLPSPSKVRPKLKPVPRLGPRRNSIQGSASESEDDTRRSLMSGGAGTPGPSRQRHDSHSYTTHTPINREVSRVRNDSVCSSLSQATGTQAPSSPIKEKSSYQKTRRLEASKRLMAMRRRREAVKREALTMYDLIFYNPTTNPILPNEDEIKAKEEAAKDLKQAKIEIKADKSQEEPAQSDAAPVPQIKLGPNGEIILDETSLVINQTQTSTVSSVVHEGGWLPSQGQYKRTPRSAEWSAVETVRFYRALAAIGTDFTLMAPLFPDRTRRELKVKFKKEEKLNGALVDKALRSTIEWDAASLGETFTQERDAAKVKAEQEKQKFMHEKEAERKRIRSAKEENMRKSRGSKALELCPNPGIMRASKVITSADDVIKRAKYKQMQKPTPVIKSPPFAKLSNVNKRRSTTPIQEMATITKITTPNKTAEVVTSLDNIPTNIETGSLIVLTVDDPTCPGKKMLQTYLAHEPGKLKQIALPPTLLNSVVGYMKKDTPRSTVSNASSPQLLSPNSVASSDSRTNTPMMQKFPNCPQRKRENSFTIMQL